MAATAPAPSLLEEIVAIRHDLHAHPELGYTEKRTCEVIQRELRAAGVEFAAGLAGGTGVLGWIPAKGSVEGWTDGSMDGAPDLSSTRPHVHTSNLPKTIALRADMDALPILEATGKEYASQTPGIMHACGHDGHTSILLGVAKTLAAMDARPNNVLLLFQPAEEGGAGGKRMVEDGALSGKAIGKPADMIFGLHGWTTLPLGQVATRVGPMMAATTTFAVTIRGQGGHAAAPHTTVDPIVIAAHLIVALQSIASRTVDPFDSVVVTVGQVEAGTTTNVIPHTATIRGTVRTMLAETRKLAEKRLRETAAGVALAFGARAEVEWIEGYPCTCNAPEAVEAFMKAASNALGPEVVSDQGLPTMGGEDFSFYGSECPACFFQLGLIPPGKDSYPSVHTPEFDFNDAAIPIGIKVFVELATGE